MTRFLEPILERLRRNDALLTELDASSRALGPYETTVLANSLGGNTTLTRLNVDGNRIEPVGVKAVAGALCNCQLASLSLSKVKAFDNGDNHGDDQAAAHLAKALMSGKHLTRLNLSGNSMRLCHVQTLAGALPYCRLTSLNVSGCGIESQGAVALATSLTFNGSLTELNVSSNFVRDDGAASLATLLTLNTTLTRLNLSDNGIADRGYAALAEALRVNTTLSILRVEDNYPPGAAGGEALGAALAVNTTLQHLAFEARGDGIVPLVQGLAQSNSVTELLLSHLSVDRDDANGVCHVLGSCSNLVRLDVSGDLGPRECRAVFQVVEKHSSLRKLHVTQNGRKAAAGLLVALVLVRNTTLRELSLNSAMIIEFIRALWEPDTTSDFIFGVIWDPNTTLRRLVISEALLSVADVDVLNHYLGYVHCNIVCLDLSTCSADAAALLQLSTSLQHNRHLRRLVLNGGWLDRRGWNALFTTLRQMPPDTDPLSIQTLVERYSVRSKRRKQGLLCWLWAAKNMFGLCRNARNLIVQIMHELDHEAEDEPLIMDEEGEEQFPRAEKRLRLSTSSEFLAFTD